MTGKVWIFAETFYEKNDIGEIDYSQHIDYIEHDYPEELSYEDKGWFFLKSDCEKSALSQKEYTEENVSVLSCVDRCFCGLYRIQLKKYFSKGNYKRSWLLFIAGFHRMLKDHAIFIYHIVRMIDRLFGYIYRGLKWVVRLVKRESSKC